MEKMKCKVITSPIMMLSKGERTLEMLLDKITNDVTIKELMSMKSLYATSSGNNRENPYCTFTYEAWGLIDKFYIEDNDIYADVMLLPEKRNYDFIKEKSKTVPIDLYMHTLAVDKQFDTIKVTMFYTIIG